MGISEREEIENVIKCQIKNLFVRRKVSVLKIIPWLGKKEQFLPRFSWILSLFVVR